ncbi:MAG: PAS domain S-box protein, partial [Methanomicrobiales archaeon]
MPVEKFPDEISRIRALLSESPEGLTIKNISEMLGMNRNAAANNLYLLQMQGRVTLKRIGTAKIYCQANKLPVDAVLKLSNNGVIVFDRGEVVLDINEQFRELLHLAKQDLIGKTTGQLPFFVESNPELPRLVRDGLKGEENRVAAELVLTDRSLPCTLTILPVFFENGEPGVALIANIPAVARYPHRNEYGADDSLAELDMTEYICRFAPDGTLTYVNQAYGDLLQKGKTELTGHRWRPTVPESEYNKIKQCLLSLDSANPVTSLDFNVITPRGDFRRQRWRFRNLFDQTGKSIGYQGTGIDITDMKNLEEMVQKGAEERECLVKERLAEIQDLNRQIYHEIASHEKTHTQLQFTQFAIDNASYLIMWANRGGRFVYMNREAQAVLGYQHRDLVTKKFQEIIVGVFPFSWDEIWETILRDRQYTVETVIMAHDGREIPVEMGLNYLKFKDKQYCCCFAKDITERKLAESALAKSFATFRTVMDSLDALVYVADMNTFEILFVNQYGSKIWGDLTGKICWESLQSDQKGPCPFCTNEKLLHNEGHPVGIIVWEFQNTITGQWYECHDSAIQWIDGRIVRIEIATDITERKRAEEALSESEQKYREIFEKSVTGIFKTTHDGLL